MHFRLTRSNIRRKIRALHVDSEQREKDKKKEKEQVEAKMSGCSDYTSEKEKGLMGLLIQYAAVLQYSWDRSISCSVLLCSAVSARGATVHIARTCSRRSNALSREQSMQMQRECRASGARAPGSSARKWMRFEISGGRQMKLLEQCVRVRFPFFSFISLQYTTLHYCTCYCTAGLSSAWLASQIWLPRGPACGFTLALWPPVEIGFLRTGHILLY